MKILTTIAISLIAVAAFGQSRTPINRGFLQSNLDGNQQSITNLNDVQATGTFTGSNFFHTTWKWVDLLVAGTAVASNPSGDPPILTQVPGQNFFGYGYYLNDQSYFTVQSAHKFAMTNSLPGQADIYFQPHIHVSTTNVTAGTNATFSMHVYYGTVNGYLTNYYASTNMTTLTNTYSHYMIIFGNVTNNMLSGEHSVIWRGRIQRLDGGVGGIGNSSPIWVDSIDIDVPIQQLGSLGLQE